VLFRVGSFSEKRSAGESTVVDKGVVILELAECDEKCNTPLMHDDLDR